MTEPYFDWRVTAAAHVLAEHLWDARLEAYPQDGDRTWVVQDAPTQARYIRIAGELLKTLQPAPKQEPPSDLFQQAVKLTRWHAEHVLGIITPDPRD